MAEGKAHCVAKVMNDIKVSMKLVAQWCALLPAQAGSTAAAAAGPTASFLLSGANINSPTLFREEEREGEGEREREKGRGGEGKKHEKSASFFYSLLPGAHHTHR